MTVNWLKQLFCRHKLEAYEKAESISFLGIALWARFDCYCTKCGAQKYGVTHDKCSTHEMHLKEMAILEAQLAAQEALYQKRQQAAKEWMRKFREDMGYGEDR